MDNDNESQNTEKSRFEIIKRGAENYDLKYQVIFIGESSVGKTSICMRQTKSTFTNDYLQTSCYDNYFTDVNYKDLTLKIEIFDASGNEEYINLISPLFHKVSLAVIVYSIDE